MIYGTIRELDLWAERIPTLRKALLASKALAEAEFRAERIEIDGTKIYAFGSEYAATPRENLRFENHRAYADVQMLLSGVEAIDVVIPDRPAEGEYSAERDIEFTDFREYSTVTLHAGEFLLLLPGEWHRPCVSLGKASERCRKTVTKIKIGE